MTRPTEQVIVEQRTDLCVFCSTTRADHDEYECGPYVRPDDLCETCMGSGYERTDSEFTDGRRCRHCAGEGWRSA